MKPLNHSERNSAFWRFLLFFSVTVALIVIVFFFSIEVPNKENDRLRQQIVVIQNERELSSSFNAVMKEAMDELNKFHLKLEPPSATNQRIQFKVRKMEELLKTMPNGEGSVYALMVRNIADLNDAKTKLSLARLE